MKAKAVILIILGALLIAVSCLADTHTFTGEDGEEYTVVVQKQALVMSGPYTTSFYYDFDDEKKEEDILTDVKSKCEKAKADYNTLIANMKAEADSREVE